MNFNKIDNNYFLRIDRGEKIVQELKQFVSDHDIFCGKISAIGAVEMAEIGLFKAKEKKYESIILSGDFEIASLLGNITSFKGESYLHIHATFSDQDHKCWGGHLNEAVVSATCEVIIETFFGTVQREYDSEVGLNILKF
jgi:hypothetical protein